MNTVKILHTADIHIGALDSFLGENSEKRRAETLLTFERIIDLAVSENVQLIAIAGDLFDSNSVEERFYKAVFEKIEKSGIATVFAAGNHDPLNSQSPFLKVPLPQNLYVLGEKDEVITFEELKLKVYGRSFRDTYLQGEEQFTLSTDKDYVNLMVQHGELKSDLSSDYNSITPRFVKNSKMDYIALGHVHKRTPIGKIDNTSFAYSGCVEGQGFDELEEKGVYIGEIGKGICNLSFVPVSKRQHIHHKTDVTNCETVSAIAEKIIAELQEAYGEAHHENLYKIELTGEVSPEFIISRAELLSRLENAVYFVKIKDSTELKLDIDALLKEPSLKGIYVRKMLQKIEDAPEDKKEICKKALKLGVKAFSVEVKYDED